MYSRLIFNGDEDDPSKLAAAIQEGNELLLVIFHPACRGDRPVSFGDFGQGFPTDFVCPHCQQPLDLKDMGFNVAARPGIDSSSSAAADTLMGQVNKGLEGPR